MKRHWEFLFGVIILFLMVVVLWKFIEPDPLKEIEEQQQSLVQPGEEEDDTEPVSSSQEMVSVEESTRLLNATYFVDGEPKKFVNGEYELVDDVKMIREFINLYPTVEKPLIAKKDVTGDAQVEFFVIVSRNLGGTGHWKQISVMNKNGEQLDEVGVGGDRTIVKNMYFKGEDLIVDVIVHGPNDPLCCPTVEESWRYHFDSQTGKLVNVTGALPKVPVAPESEGYLPPEQPVFCTSMDVKMCPDGSYVKRVAPNCEFQSCPDESSNEQIVCPVEARDAEVCMAVVEPVCGLVQVQCVAAPCNPIPETFSNSCEACKNKNVVSYAAGACI